MSGSIVLPSSRGAAPAAAPYAGAAPSDSHAAAGIGGWVLAVAAGLALFGSYYANACVAPLADVLVDQLHFTDTDIGLLQGIYNLPNIGAVILGGILIDGVGTRKATLLFSGLCLCGAVLTASTPVFGVMAAGRMVFGLGAESLFVALATTVGRRFSSIELGFAFGISVGIGRLGSLAALNSPTWAPWAYATWRGPLLISVAASGFSAMAAALSWTLHVRIASPVPHRNKGVAASAAMRTIRRLGPSYWLMVALFVAFSSAVFPFQTFAVKFLQQVLGLTRQAGGFLSSVVILSMIVSMPVLDVLASRMTNPGRLLVVGAALLVPVFGCFVWGSVPPSLLLIIMGAVYSLNPAVLWPAVRRIVDTQDLGTAYGVMISAQNVGLVVVNVAVGGANDHWAGSAANPGGYLPGLWIFTGLAGVSLVLALWLSRVGVMRRIQARSGASAPSSARY